jgi:hypothetical protein
VATAPGRVAAAARKLSRVASAFISYAHEDQELMLELVEHLQAQGLDIRYDQVVLQIGDSLIQKIAGEIADGDFLIAIISPDSVESGWCQRELSLAATQGINEKRAKVLPVRFRGAQIPAMLGDIFYGDADRFSGGRLGRWQHPRSERPAAAVALGARPPAESSPRCAPAGRADGERRQRLVLRRR